MLEHLTYNKSKQGERGRERRRERRGEREKGGEGERTGEGEKGGPQPMCFSHSIFTLSTLLWTRRSLQAQVGDANQSINFKLYLRDQPGDLRARRVSRSAIVDLITSSGLCARKERKQRFKSRLFWLHLPLHVSSIAALWLWLDRVPFLRSSWFLPFSSSSSFATTHTLPFSTHSLSDGTTVRLVGWGDVFPPARLPAVLKCLPGGVRGRQTGSAYAFVPRREHRNRRKSFRHGGGGHLRPGHVRQPVRAQLQRFLTVHQRGFGSFFTNGKNIFIFFIVLFSF